MFDLDLIDTIFVLMMENRSFDHMMGYLSLPPYNRKNLAGINQAWLASYVNQYQGNSYIPWHRSELTMPADPPHERGDIAVQIGPFNPAPPMNGFIESYASDPQAQSSDYADVLGYYTPAEVPITDFFAANFAVCDHWFAALPTSTQPNRLMAMSGYSLTDHTSSAMLADQHLVYDWLSEKNVRWRVYHEGLPFFMLMPKVLEQILADAPDHKYFRRFDWLKADLLAPVPFPQVVFIEPKFTDAPHFGQADDDHPTTSIAPGQDFLSRVYAAVTVNLERWKRSVLIVVYDENGGFFDHVPPSDFATPQLNGETYLPFQSLGVRVPALVISPLVPAETVFNQALNHTSILKLIAAKFDPGNPYSPAVAAQNRVGNVADVLNLTAPRNDLPQAPSQTLPAATASASRPVVPASPNALAFTEALKQAKRLDRTASAQKFPAWSDYFRR